VGRRPHVVPVRGEIARHPARARDPADLFPRSRSSSAGMQVAPVNSHGLKLSYDAAQGDDSESRRGRSLIFKALGSLKQRSVSDLQDE
jgi:hypothetical protein